MLEKQALHETSSIFTWKQAHSQRSPEKFGIHLLNLIFKATHSYISSNRKLQQNAFLMHCLMLRQTLIWLWEKSLVKNRFYCITVKFSMNVNGFLNQNPSIFINHQALLLWKKRKRKSTIMYLIVHCKFLLCCKFIM